MINRNPSNSVFVGNIPYDATEKQLEEVFQQVGDVVSFRLVYDKDSQKPKGYGFCEFKDADTASSAIRNLNNYEFSGRNLRVDTAEQGLKRKMEMLHSAPGPKAPLFQQQGGPIVPSNVLPIPAGVPKSGEQITGMMKQMNKKQLYQIVAHFKALIQQNFAQAHQLLVANPQLTYALLQAQVILGMAPNIVQQIQNATQAQPQTQPHPNPPIHNPSAPSMPQQPNPNRF